MRIALVLSMLIVSSACSSTLLSFGRGDETRFRHRELGYEVAYPGVLVNAGWKTGSLDEADLLVRHPDGSAWAMASNCRGTKAGLSVLASELVRAAEGRRVGEAQPIRAGGLDGVSQRLEGGSAAPRLQIKTVTLRGALCTYDWVLIAPTAGRYAELEDGFDVWWQSFEPGPTERPVASRAEGRS